MNNLRALLSELGVDASGVALDATIDLVVGDVAFALDDRDLQDAEGLYAYCEFGALPTGEAALTAVTELMAINLARYARNAPSFGFNTDTRKVVLATRLARADLTADALHAFLQDMACKARAWRDDQRFGNEPALMTATVAAP